MTGLKSSPTTRTLKLHACPAAASNDVYGTDAPLLAALPGQDRLLQPALPCSEAMVRFASRHEAAHTIEDVLARRTRALFLDAAAAATTIERVAEIFADELGLTPEKVATMIASARENARRFMPAPLPTG